MDKKKEGENLENVSVNEDAVKDEVTNLQEEQSISADDSAKTDNVSDELEELRKKYEELNDSHLRLMAEFDNYRKRTMREKSELIKTGGEGALKNLLPVIDDFERALQNVRVAADVEAVKEGVDLIFDKFMGYLSRQGVKPIEAVGKEFNTEEFEAIATIPAPEPGMKGKIIDCVQTGYMLFDKVMRHARVVVGE